MSCSFQLKSLLQAVARPKYSHTPLRSLAHRPSRLYHPSLSHNRDLPNAPSSSAPEPPSIISSSEITTNSPQPNESNEHLSAAPPSVAIHETSQARQPSSTQSPQSSKTNPPQTTYYVSRTPSKELPVYLLRKRGGNYLATRLKKISGDINSLRNDIQEALKLSEEQVWINHLNRHIQIKGHHKSKLVDFLKKKSF